MLIIGVAYTGFIKKEGKFFFWYTYKLRLLSSLFPLRFRMSSCGSPSTYRILDELGNSSPYRAEVDRKLARVEVRYDALKRQVSQASCLETLLVVGDKCSQLWDLMTDLHAEMLKSASSCAMLKVRAEKLEDKLSDLEMEIVRIRPNLKSSSPRATPSCGSEAFETKPCTVAEPKFKESWSTFKPSCQEDHSPSPTCIQGVTNQRKQEKAFPGSSDGQLMNVIP